MTDCFGMPVKGNVWKDDLHKQHRNEPNLRHANGIHHHKPADLRSNWAVTFWEYETPKEDKRYRHAGRVCSQDRRAERHELRISDTRRPVDEGTYPTRDQESRELLRNSHKLVAHPLSGRPCERSR